MGEAQVTCILEAPYSTQPIASVEMHTMEDALAVGHWLRKNGIYTKMRIMDADPAFQGNVIMDPDVFEIRVEQYGEKVEDDSPR
jgi:hypothetical protein